MAGNNVLEATDANFETEVLRSSQLALVDFWAEWCGPCRMLAPVIEALADQFAGRVKVLKLNVDENPATPTRYHIRGIPTVILFKNGTAVDQLVGSQPRDAIARAIEKHL